MSQEASFSADGNTVTVHTTPDAQHVLDIFWERELEQIRSLSLADFKSQELPLARIKKIMKLDEDVKMISAEAPVLFAKAAEIFITELSLRSWIHTEDNKRRTLQRNDIAMAISKYDQFDFLIDIVPREEMKPPKRHEDGSSRQGGQQADQQVQYYFQLAQQHQAALQQQTPTVVQQGAQLQAQQQQGPQIQLVQAAPSVQQVTQAMPVPTTSPTFSVPSVLQLQAVAAENAQQQVQAAQQVQVQVPNAQAAAATQQVLQLQQQVSNQVGQQGGIQIVQQYINSNGEIQQIPIQLSPSQLQLIRMQMQGHSTSQPIIIHAAPVQQAASQVQQAATQVSAENGWAGVNPTNAHIMNQTVYQLQQVAQGAGQGPTPVFLTQTQGGTIQVQAVSAEHTSGEEEQQT